MKKIISFVIFLTYLLFPLHSFAASVLPLDLSRIHGEASYVFHGQCIANDAVEDPQTGMIVTVTTFSILETLKGNVEQTYTIKQVGGKLPKSSDLMMVPGVPKFEIGKNYVVFLPQPSRLGFSSPIGLDQGKFDILLDKQGNNVVGNGRDFTQLLENVPQQNIPSQTNALNNNTVVNKKIKRTRMQLNDFLSIVRKMGNKK